MGIARKQLEAKGLIGKSPATSRRHPSLKTLLRNDQWMRDMYSELGGIFSTRTLPSGANLREFHWVKAKRVKAERDAGWWMGTAAANAIPPAITPPCTVTLTRYGPRLLDEDDNLPMSFKHVKDGIADALGTDDAKSSGITWKYQQVKTYPGCNGFRVEITKQP